MSEKWYPVIDTEKCIECGACIKMCGHDVYKTDSAAPIVANPNGCIENCEGCGKLCPVGAIDYIGKELVVSESSCSCGCGETPKKKVVVEYLYLDLKTCDRCKGTDAVLESVLKKLAPTFELAGYSIDYIKTEITSEESAREHRFLSSPTVRVNGRDICDSVAENSCDCCGDISGVQTDCRIFNYGGKSYEIPPEAMLAEAVLQNAFLAQVERKNNGYTLPDNLKTFFKGKGKKQSCHCGKKNCCN